MQVLEIEEILNKINRKELFEATSSDSAIYIKIEDYQPVICTTIHNGHNLRQNLIQNCLLNDYERWYEEDPCTLQFVSEMPIVLASNDSRYEYDLNRSVEEAIYTVAWGKKVWKSPLNKAEKELSLQKYRNFYRTAEELIKKLESIFPKVFVFDIHSYNYQRIERETPLFNLGTKGVDESRFDKEINGFLVCLQKIELPEIKTTVKRNDVFEGRGHFTLYISVHFHNTLVFPLEIKKVYCNELTGEIVRTIINLLSTQLKNAITQTVKNIYK